MPGSPAGTPHLADPENWVVSASAEVKAAQPRAWRVSLPAGHRRLSRSCWFCSGSSPSRCDSTHHLTARLSRSIESTVSSSMYPSPIDGPGLQTGDVVIEIAGHRLADGLGGLARPQLGDELAYDVTRDGTARVTVRVNRTDPYPLWWPGGGTSSSSSRWPDWRPRCSCGDPRSRRPPDADRGGRLLGSTLAFTAGIPALTLATGGPALWLYNLSVVGVYSLAWGPVLAFGLQLFRLGRGRGPGRAVLAAAYTAPLGLIFIWMIVAAAFAANSLRWFDLVYAAQTVIVAATLVTGGVLGIVAYRRSRDPLTRSRLRWLAGGSIAACVLGLVGWHLPAILTGEQLLPSGAIGLSGLPFVVAIAVALRRHRLFDIERLANRSLVYVSLVAILVAGYAALVALLVSGLRLSGTVAAAIAAAAAALALAPLRTSPNAP